MCEIKRSNMLLIAADLQSMYMTGRKDECFDILSGIIQDLPFVGAYCTAYIASTLYCDDARAFVRELGDVCN